MLRATMLCMALWAGPFAAQEAPWQPMAGAEITQALTGPVVDYANAWQDFRASGRTLYPAAAEPWGSWAVRGNQYCSMWPPSDLWACYDVEGRGDAVRFVGPAGDMTEGRVRRD